MNETIEIDSKVFAIIVDKLKSALEPMVPYKRDPLEFSEAAHEVKNELIEEVLEVLGGHVTEDIVKRAEAVDHLVVVAEDVNGWIKKSLGLEGSAHQLSLEKAINSYQTLMFKWD